MFVFLWLQKSKVTLWLNYRLQRVGNGGDWRGHREDGGRVLDIDNENEDLNFNDVTRIDHAVGVGIPEKKTVGHRSHHVCSQLYGL